MLTVGSTTYPFIAEGLKEYEKRLKKYFSFDIVCLADVKNRGKLEISKLKEQEFQLIEKHIKPEDTLILLDERGEQFNSVGFARFLQSGLSHKKGKLVFVIGGMYGFDDRLKQKASKLLSLSAMTTSHQLARLIFAEQLYRACTILNGEPYHNEG